MSGKLPVIQNYTALNARTICESVLLAQYELHWTVLQYEQRPEQSQTASGADTDL